MNKITTGEYLITLLEAYDVDYIFGIPGVHTIELYRGLENSRIRHITPRHEQGAGFMADGYARISNKPGVCLVITGPGLSNIATAMLQARADSIPMLVISAINDPNSQSRGKLHEIPDQSAFAKTIAIHSHSISKPEGLAPTLAKAFHQFEAERPGPVHMEIPLSVMKMSADHLPRTPSRPVGTRRLPPHAEIAQAAEFLRHSEKIVILAGGGANQAADKIMELAERLVAPIITTTNARAKFGKDHPLVVPLSASTTPVRNLVRAADTVMAIGTELGETDYDVEFQETRLMAHHLIRIDIDENRLQENEPADIAICGDAKSVMETLIPLLKSRKRADFLDKRQLMDAVEKDLPASYTFALRLLEEIRERVPDLLFVGDSTHLIYAGNTAFAPQASGAWFNSATGYGTLGYALSAAIGAKLGAPDKPVLAIIGDGGLQFCLGELGALKDYGNGIVILIWNNDGYGEIKNFMLKSDVEPVGVDLKAPDFSQIAEAYGLKSLTIRDESQIAEAVEAAFKSGETMIINAVIAE